MSISPCQLPIYPVLLNMLSKDGVDRKISTLAFSIGHAMMYAIVYLILALGFQALGEIAFDSTYDFVMDILYFVGAVILFIFAAQTLGYIKFFTKTFQAKRKNSKGIFGSFLNGAFFATIVSPCNLPYLIAVYLPLLANSTTVLEGLSGVLIFTFALSTPLLIMGFVSTHAFEKILSKHMRKVEYFSAGLLFVTGLYFLWQALS